MYEATAAGSEVSTSPPYGRAIRQPTARQHSLLVRSIVRCGGVAGYRALDRAGAKHTKCSNQEREVLISVQSERSEKCHQRGEWLDIAG